jgi:hypothetical protein
LTFYYSKYKDSLSSRELKISLKDICEHESIEELEKSLIYREVESMLVELTFDGLLDHFSKKMQIDLAEQIIDWELIKECRERRHIIVHNGSVVNKKYLTRTNNPDNLKIGDKIKVSKEYFWKSFNEFRLAGHLLSFNCWGNWDKQNIDTAIHQMLMESFEYLQINLYDSCYRLTTYSEKITPRNEDQEDYLLRMKFNQCIALKKLGKKPELKKVLSSIKVGTSTPLFKLAHAILSDNTEKVIIGLVEQAYALEDINKTDYLEWPLFEFLRAKEKMNNKILDLLKN